MTDLDLGMNTWMSKPFDYPTKPFDRGKRLDADKLKTIGEFARYRDVDGDGIPYRTVPGDGMPPVLHPRLGSQREGAVQRARRRLHEQPRSPGRRSSRRRGRSCRSPTCEMAGQGGIGIIAYGTSHWALIESRDQLKNEQKIDTSYFRLRALSVHARSSSTSSMRTTASTSSIRTATGRCGASSSWNATRSRSPSCAASATTTGCRLTGGR